MFSMAAERFVAEMDQHAPSRYTIMKFSNVFALIDLDSQDISRKSNHLEISG